MSLQTPRVLTDDDVAKLLQAAGREGTTVAAPSTKGYLNAHDADGAVPCLCRKCVGVAPERVVVDGLALVRDRAEAGGRFVWYWLPETLSEERPLLRRAVESQLHARARVGVSARFENLDTVFADAGAVDDEGDDAGDDEEGDDE